MDGRSSMIKCALPSTKSITIIRRPAGPAPEWVRDAWIGITLPTSEKRPMSLFAMLEFPTSLGGALKMIARGRLRPIKGYRVKASDALCILKQTHPEAAQWWKENAAFYVKGNKRFLFDADCCSLSD
jgi:hypothetical protein